MQRRWMAGMIVALGLWLPALEVAAQPVAQRIGVGDTARLFGGPDAEGGIGDWYLSNGVVEAIVDDVGIQSDLTGLVVAGNEPAIQSEIAPTGGTLLDVSRVGVHGDHLPQMFLVGGLSTSNFVLYDTIAVTAPGVLRATGALLLPPLSARPTPCVALVTDFSAQGSDPFFTLTTTATNGCAAPAGLGNFLDAIVWTQRGIIPFSGGGRGFDHPVLDFANPASALETPAFLGAPGVLTAADGVCDPATGTPCGEVAYGLLGVSVTVDQDGDGPGEPATTAVNGLFGVSSNLVTALGALPATGTLDPGGTLTYVRRLYVGARDDVRSVSDPMITELATRQAFTTGTISGNVDAADTADVAATLTVVRLGRCAGNAALVCAGDADCAGAGACADPTVVPGFAPGAATTHVRTDASGAFAGVVLPQGLYEVRVTAAERDDVVVRPIAVGAGDTVVAVPPLAARGILAFDVREKARRRPRIPAKLVVKGVAPTPDPRFARRFSASLGDEDLRPWTFGGSQEDVSAGSFAQGNVVYTTTGEGQVPLAPGTYEVWVSRGMEYGLVREQVTIAAGQTATVTARLKRVLRTRDALSADFHVHSARSLDSSAPLGDRLASFAAEGVEVLVSTDHDKHLDYAPIASALGLDGLLATIPGVEVTGSVPNPPMFPNAIGHINAWPMPVEAGAPRDGAVQDEFVAPNWVFTRLRRLGGPDTVVQYNHPRAGISGLTSIGIFNSIGCGRCANAIDTTCDVAADCPAGADQECTCVGYQPDRPLEAAPNDLLLDAGVLGPGTAANPDGTRNLDFDVMEVANGADASAFPQLRQVRDDWFSLLNQGVFKPGTAVSDSHRITVEHAGWARTYVLGVGDDPAGLDLPAFNQRVKAGAMVMAAGPWVEVSARAGRARGGPGETIAASGKVRLRIVVRSPAWIPVEEVRVLANGVVLRTYDAATKPRVRPVPKNVQSSGGTTRLTTTLAIRPTQDTWIVVEAGARLPADPAVVPTSPEPLGTIEPGVVPVAITNPIFLDVGGDGFTPPGLAPAPAALAAGRGGRMTGVRRSDRAAAIAAGHHFPLYDFAIPGAAVPR